MHKQIPVQHLRWKCNSLPVGMVRVEKVWGFVCSPVDHDLKEKAKHVVFGVSVSVLIILDSRRSVWDLGSVVGTEGLSFFAFLGVVGPSMS
jgi:hypothetical protein